jgi:hypothetical protein
MARIEFVEAPVVDGDHVELPHVTTALKSNCIMSQWYIVRILHRSNYKCHAQ